ncbi:MAG TPA: YkvA family protein [Methylophilaceae bacterium]|nr:YkvA family protein [Methylophilaceae bacterium]
MKQKLRQIAQNLKAEFQVYRLVLRHPLTPRPAKWLLGLAIGYVLMPFDLIPDFIPILGQLDDLIIVPGLVYLALKLIPLEIIQECRKEMEREKCA